MVAGGGNAPPSNLAYEASVRLSQPAINSTFSKWSPSLKANHCISFSVLNVRTTT